MFRFSLLQTVLLSAFSNPFLGATWTIVSPENNSHALFIALRFFVLHRYAFFFFLQVEAL